MSKARRPSPVRPHGQVEAGDLIIASPRAVADPETFIEDEAVTTHVLQRYLAAFGAAPGVLPAPGNVAAEALFVLEIDEESIIAVKLGLMSTEAAANHVPHLAQHLTKPKVFFIGGAEEPVLLAVAYLATDQQPTGAQRFGTDGQFAIIHTSEDSPSLEEQLEALTAAGDGAGSGEQAESHGHAGLHGQEGSVLRGLRLFHSYLRIDKDDLLLWQQAGLVEAEPATGEDVMNKKPTETWRDVMRRRPFPENLFSTWAAYPERN